MAMHLESDIDNITGSLRFTTDKERWPAYEILLRAKLGKKLRKALDQAIESEAQAQAICMQTQDFQRAYKAFVEKKLPVFSGD